jgi:hypothetical protein
MIFLKLTEGGGKPVYLQLDKIETIRPYSASYSGSKINFRQDDAPVYVRETPEEIFEQVNTIEVPPNV